MAFAFLSDLIGRLRNTVLWHTAGLASLLAAVIGAALAVVAGYYDMGLAILGHNTHEYVHVRMKIG